VLIISSYSSEVYWNGALARTLVADIREQYPAAVIIGRHLNADMNPLPEVVDNVIKSGMWEIAGSKEKQRGNLLHSFLTVPQDDCADVIVLIGDEASAAFGRLVPELGIWNDVPVVMCITDTEFQQIKYPNPMTGVRLQLPVYENLKLISTLNHNLKKLVWVDNDYLSARQAYAAVKAALPDVLPNVQLERLISTPQNVDSIYTCLTAVHEDVAFLTLLWNISDRFSMHSMEQLHSMFNAYLLSPLFSLSPQSMDMGMWTGGYHIPIPEIVNRMSNLLVKILQGAEARSLPVERITKGESVLDHRLLERYDLLDAAKLLPDVHIVNEPWPFYRWALTRVLFLSLLALIIGGVLLFWAASWLQNNLLRKNHKRYCRLHDRLQAIYKRAGIDFAVYNEVGEQVMSVVNQLEKGEERQLLAKRLQQIALWTEEDSRQWLAGHTVLKEITLKADSTTLPDKRFRLIAYRIKGGRYAGHLLVLVMDITKLQIIADERNELADFLRYASDTSGIGVMAYKLHAEGAKKTHPWCKNLGENYSPNAISTYQHVQSPYREEIQAWLAGAKSEPFNQEIIVDTEGNLRWVRLILFINTDDPDLLIGLNINVTKQKEEEVCLQEAIGKADQARQDKEIFINSINHEVRTPLNAIVGFSTILSLVDEENEDTDNLKTLILRNNRLLTMLIDNIIELSEVEAGSINFTIEPIKVSELYEKARDMGYLSLYDKKLDIIFEETTEQVIYTDKAGILRVLLHLLSNAIKFTDKGCIRIGMTRTPDDRFYCGYMTDTGCGISPEEIENIFKPFYKIDSYQQGTGLGLTLCKALVTHMGGSIEIKSELNEGTRVEVKLPIPDIARSSGQVLSD
jgi:signal transduction histidine kinase